MSSDPIEKLLDIEASNQVALDRLIEANKQAVRERVDALLKNPAERNVALWDLFEFPEIQVTIDDYAATPLFDRDVPWINELGTMLAAAEYQAVVEIAGLELLNIIEANGQRLLDQTDRMSRADIIAAAKQGVGKERREKAANA